MKNFNTVALGLGLITIYMASFTSTEELAVCNLPIDEGQTGNNSGIRIYYDKITDSCKTFSYKGKGGNGNNFFLDKHCMRNCSKRAEELYPTDDRACMLPMSMGDCKGHILMYYFDSIKKQCVSFLYGGCGGNGNRFFLRRMCKTFCASKIGSDQPGAEDDEPVANEALLIGLGMGFALVAVVAVAGVILFLQRKKLREKASKNSQGESLTDGIQMK